MIVGRGMAREVPGDEMAVPIDAIEPAAAKGAPLLRLEERASSSPPSRCQAKDQLTSRMACSRLAHQLAPRGYGTLLEPGIDEGPRAFGIALPRGQMPGLRQR